MCAVRPEHSFTQKQIAFHWEDPRGIDGNKTFIIFFREILTVKLE